MSDRQGKHVKTRDERKQERQLPGLQLKAQNTTYLILAEALYSAVGVILPSTATCTPPHTDRDSPVTLQATQPPRSVKRSTPHCQLILATPLPALAGRYSSAMAGEK